MFAYGTNLKLFAANSNRALAESIAADLGIKLGDGAAGIFSDGETALSINETVRGCDVYILQSTSRPVNDNLMELLLFIDAFKRASAGRVTAVIPYFGYARQDRKSKPRDPISAKLVADLIETAGADRVLTMDLHAPQIQGFFNIPVDHLSGISILAPYFISMLGEDIGNITAVSPDFGSVTRARQFARLAGVPIAIIDKKRERANVCEVCSIIGDVRGRDCILIDDMIDTAGTICNAAVALIETGGARRVYACATHGVLSGDSVKRLAEAPFEKIVLLDTISIPQEAMLPNLTVLPSVSCFAEAIRRLHLELPISAMMS